MNFIYTTVNEICAAEMMTRRGGILKKVLISKEGNEPWLVPKPTCTKEGERMYVGGDAIENVNFKVRKQRLHGNKNYSAVLCWGRCD